MNRAGLALTGAVAALFRSKAAELRALADTHGALLVVDEGGSILQGIVPGVDREGAHVLHAERGGWLCHGVHACFAIHAGGIPTFEVHRSAIAIGDPGDIQAGVEHE